VNSFDALDELRGDLPEGTKLIAVSKNHSIKKIRSFYLKGQRDFGESKLQEALPKIETLSEFNDIRWHFLGRIQSNKVRSIIKNFCVIHSCDSIKLLERISRISHEENKFPELMLQVKFRVDINKGGFEPDDLIELWPKIQKLKNLRIIGLMTIPPLEFSSTKRIQVFKECRQLANKLDLSECSMGMSKDWREAVKSGASYVRVGSFLFGKRD